MELFRVCIPCPADGMQVAGKDVNLVPPPSSLVCVKALAHSLLESQGELFLLITHMYVAKCKGTQ